MATTVTDSATNARADYPFPEPDRISEHGYCRNCAEPLDGTVFVDLGATPLANQYLTERTLRQPETWFPLRPLVCQACLLVQVPKVQTAGCFFDEYDYFSGQSTAWREHCARYAERMVAHMRLGRTSRVLEVASNDGTLLTEFHRLRVPAVGIEPAQNVGRHAQLAGVPTLARFMGRELARELLTDGYRADLIVANNVLAHVPDLDDFLGGIELLLAAGGVATFEFPTLERLVSENQFDTIYHEHHSYFSQHTAVDALQRRGLHVFGSERLGTHGGSLRLYAQRASEPAREWHGPSGLPLPPLGLTDEPRLTLEQLAAYRDRPVQVKTAVLRFLIRQRHQGRTVAAYGAPAKGNTLLNYCGVGRELIPVAVDTTPAKQGKWLPGSRIPILPPDAIAERRPDVLFVLPWNHAGEIVPRLEREAPWAEVWSRTTDGVERLA